MCEDPYPDSKPAPSANNEGDFLDPQDMCTNNELIPVAKPKRRKMFSSEIDT